MIKHKKSSSELLAYLEANSHHFVEALFTAPNAPRYPKKVSLRPLLIKGAQKLQVSSFTATQCFVKNHPKESLATLCLQFLAQYKSLCLQFSHEVLHVQVLEEGMVHWKTKKQSIPVLPSMTHNRQKEYLIPDGTPVDFLIALGLMNQEGRVFREKFHKFKQINRFLEYVFQVLSLDKKGPLRIIDLGCGKSYLTFALYHVLRGRDVNILGVDVREDLVVKCQALADTLGYKGLEFCTKPIEHFSLQEEPDLVIALHACDRATDEAIAKACAMKAKAILVAPCCQHEVLHQIRKEAMPLILSHPLLCERFSALITDALRAEILKQHGYQVDFVEFVDPEHTPKNILIRAKKLEHPPAADWEKFRALTKEFGIRNLGNYNDLFQKMALVADNGIYTPLSSRIGFFCAPKTRG